MTLTKAILRWSIPLAGLLLVGPLAGMCTIGLRGADGSDAVTPMLSSSPVMGLVMGLMAMVIAGAFGAVATWINGFKSGFFTTGLVLAWATWGLGNMDDIMRRTQSASTMWKLSGEGLVLGAAAVAVALGLLAVHHRRLQTSATVSTAPVPEAAVQAERQALRQAIVRSLIAALPVMGLVVFIVATGALKGQAFAAAVAGALLSVVAGLWATRSAPPFVFIVAAAILAAASPIAATFIHGSEQSLVRASLGGTLFPLARLIPLDWIAGAFVGVPMGLSFAHGLFESHHVEQTA